ncbi:unnamed protein product [Closterium sp. NIES-53]
MPKPLLLVRHISNHYYPTSLPSGPSLSLLPTSEELSRPENKGLKAALQLLEGVKARVDKDAKGGPISYADLIQFGAQSAVKTTFLAAATRKAGGDDTKGLNLYFAIGSPGQWGFFDKQLGRADAEQADPAGRVPDWEQLSASEIKEKFAALGLTPRQVVTLALFLGRDLEAVEAKLEGDEEMKKWVAKYRKSRTTVSQTDYEGVEAKLAGDEEMKKWVAKYRKSRTTVSQTDYEGTSHWAEHGLLG